MTCASAREEERGLLLAALGGTTTVERSDWIAIAERGAEEGWYEPVCGTISALDPMPSLGTEQAGVKVPIATTHGNDLALNADDLIDCTGLTADICRTPFLEDLLDPYRLPRDHAWRPRAGRAEKGAPTGLRCGDDFEIEGLCNGAGRVYAAGTITTDGPYLAVDSFLGLQYSALHSVDHLVTEALHKVPNLGPLRLLGGWMTWMLGARR